MFQKHLSIRVRLLLLIGFASMATLGMLSYFAVSERNELLSKAAADVYNNAERIASKQNNVVSYAQQLASLLIQFHAADRLPVASNCSHLLGYVLRQEPRLANIAIATTNGDVICNATRTVQPVNIADRAYFQRALADGGTAVGKAVFGRSNGKWNLPVAKAMLGKNGSIQSVLVVSLDLQWVNLELSHVLHQAGGRIGLIDSNGIVLAR